MRAWLVLALLAGCEKPPPPPPPSPSPTRHDWGENAALVPSWAPHQERRAPKMPKANHNWTELEPPVTVDELKDGLLICRVAVANRSDPTYFRGWPTAPGKPPLGADWDTFAGPDTLIRLRIGTERPISLWGPEDHWEFYVSIPRLTMRKGDAVVLDVWDRDGGEDGPDEYISTVTTTWDGRFPWVLQAKYLYLDCRGATAEQAQNWSVPWRNKLDKALLAVDVAELRPDAQRFGEPTEIADLKEPLRFFNDVNFRYYAGFLGWEDAEVQTRLARFAAGERRWRDKVAAEMTRLESTSAALGEWQKLDAASSARVAAGSKPGAFAIDLRADSGAQPTCVTERGASTRVNDRAIVFIGDGGFQSGATATRDNGPCDASAVQHLTVDAPAQSRLVGFESARAGRVLWRIPR